MKLIVGLGNPTAEYAGTFHNVGFLALDVIAAKYNAEFKKKECRALTAHTLCGQEKVIFAKPQTFMNLSGDACIELCNKYKIAQKDFLVIYDDVDIPLGALRIRAEGSAGTHNGMRHILLCMGGGGFSRIRIGIGKPVFPIALKDYVLSKIKPDARERLDYAFENTVKACEGFIAGEDINLLSQKFNINI